ncbi:MAG TPA: DUF309 domain-containing protein [Nitrosopumilaceae archaeon]|nr:DUF309 domain-containing protein [Nitrosopumilaceae archaeon]
MDRFMLHLKNENFIPKNASDLLHQARDICEGMDVTIRDTRVSSKYLEFDVSIKKEKLDELVGKLKVLGELDHAKHVVEEKKSKEESIKEGIFYFNNERFWECHEILEGVWKNCYEGEKDLVQGIILVAAALVHYQKNENTICISILSRALEKLSNASGNYYNIDVDLLKKRIGEIKNSTQVTTFAI